MPTPAAPLMLNVAPAILVFDISAWLVSVPAKLPRSPTFRLPTMPTPPITVTAPVAVFVLVVPLTNAWSCAFCMLTGLALLTVAPT